jgi:hypothetical protein
MKHAIVGTNFGLMLDTYVGQNILIPDSGSMEYTVYDNSGQPITGLTAVAVSGVNQKNLITIPSAAQTVAGGKEFEQRTVVFTFNSALAPHTKTYSYQVTPFLNHHVTPEQVITVLGVQEGEILYDQVELLPAYFDAKQRLTDIDAALSSGTTTQTKANDLIAHLAAIRLIQTLELRAWRRFGSDAQAYQRFDTVDFDGIRRRVSGQIEMLVSDIEGDDLVTTAAGILFAVTQPTDAITGE